MFAHILPDKVIGLGCHFNFNIDVALIAWGMEKDNKQKAADLVSWFGTCIFFHKFGGY